MFYGTRSMCLLLSLSLSFIQLLSSLPNTAICAFCYFHFTEANTNSTVFVLAAYIAGGVCMCILLVLAGIYTCKNRSRQKSKDETEQDQTTLAPIAPISRVDTVRSCISRTDTVMSRISNLDNGVLSYTQSAMSLPGCHTEEQESSWVHHGQSQTGIYDMQYGQFSHDAGVYDVTYGVRGKDDVSDNTYDDLAPKAAPYYVETNKRCDAQPNGQVGDQYVVPIKGPFIAEGQGYISPKECDDEEVKKPVYAQHLRIKHKMGL